MTFSHGARYEGQWREGRCHGRGTQWKGDYRYEGGFKDGKRHGHGSLYYHGRVFVGEFVNDKATGRGTMKTEEGEILFEGPVAELSRKSRAVESQMG